MKWVLKTSSIIVGSDDRPNVFQSLDDCPPPVRKRLRDTLAGQRVFTIMITNREGLEALRAGVYPDSTTNNLRKLSRRPRRTPEFPRLPRWQAAGLALVAALAATVGLVVWAMHGG